MVSSIVNACRGETPGNTTDLAAALRDAVGRALPNTAHNAHNTLAQKRKQSGMY